ncbi:MAG: hypothetical protein U5J63_16540 [Fodinibius sp.]|nr:hypothetical protein [Fodinibius sp.]
MILPNGPHNITSCSGSSNWLCYKVKKFSNQFPDSESLTSRMWKLLDTEDLQPLESHRNRDERFISFLFDRDEAQRAARLLNNYLGENDTVVDLFIAGTGEVGETLLEKLKFAAPDGIQFRLLGVCNSRHALSDDSLDLICKTIWTGRRRKATNWNELREKLTDPSRHNLIFVDATGDEQVARLYGELLENDIHIVTPSKLANTFEQSYFDELQSLVNSHTVAPSATKPPSVQGCPSFLPSRTFSQSGDRDSGKI